MHKTDKRIITWATVYTPHIRLQWQRQQQQPHVRVLDIARFNVHIVLKVLFSRVLWFFRFNSSLWFIVVAATANAIVNVVSFVSNTPIPSVPVPGHIFSVELLVTLVRLATSILHLRQTLASSIQTNLQCTQNSTRSMRTEALLFICTFFHHQNSLITIYNCVFSHIAFEATTVQCSCV